MLYVDFISLVHTFDEPVVEGEWQIVPGGGEGVLASPGHGGGEVPGGLGSASGGLGEHLLGEDLSASSGFDFKLKVLKNITTTLAFTN